MSIPRTRRIATAATAAIMGMAVVTPVAMAQETPPNDNAALVDELQGNVAELEEVYGEDIDAIIEAGDQLDELLAGIDISVDDVRFINSMIELVNQIDADEIVPEETTSPGTTTEETTTGTTTPEGGTDSDEPTDDSDEPADPNDGGETSGSAPIGVTFENGELRVSIPLNIADIPHILTATINADGFNVELTPTETNNGGSGGNTEDSEQGGDGSGDGSGDGEEDTTLIENPTLSAVLIGEDGTRYPMTTGEDGRFNLPEDVVDGEYRVGINVASEDGEQESLGGTQLVATVADGEIVSTKEDPVDGGNQNDSDTPGGDVGAGQGNGTDTDVPGSGDTPGDDLNSGGGTNTDGQNPGGGGGTDGQNTDDGATTYGMDGAPDSDATGNQSLGEGGEGRGNGDLIETYSDVSNPAGEPQAQSGAGDTPVSDDTGTVPPVDGGQGGGSGAGASGTTGGDSGGAAQAQPATYAASEELPVTGSASKTMLAMVAGLLAAAGALFLVGRKRGMIG